MSSSIKNNIISAKNTFGKVYSKPYAGDYIRKKSITTVLCPVLKCTSMINNLSRQSNYISLKNLQNTSNSCCYNGRDLINKTNLNINLITEENLKYVDVLQKNYPVPTTPTNVDPNISFINNYTIDPKGQLFGKTQCGLRNFTHYMIYKCPI